jgi:hypothetical protein
MPPVAQGWHAKLSTAVRPRGNHVRHTPRAIPATTTAAQQLLLEVTPPDIFDPTIINEQIVGGMDEESNFCGAQGVPCLWWLFVRYCWKAPDHFHGHIKLYYLEEDTDSRLK